MPLLTVGSVQCQNESKERLRQMRSQPKGILGKVLFFRRTLQSGFLVISRKNFLLFEIDGLYCGLDMIHRRGVENRIRVHISESDTRLEEACGPHVDFLRTKGITRFDVGGAFGHDF